MVAKRVSNPEYVTRTFSINREGYKGYILRSRNKSPILPYGEMLIKNHQVIVREPTPILKKIMKQSGELHLSDIHLAIPLEETVEKFKEKFKIKVITSRLNTIPLTTIYNGDINLEIERTKLTKRKVPFIYVHV
ncbi:hypothetical protein CHS0354_004701 [Potamilus streckersoni]|uniref:Uncharacterized protein n=1 Tax=Potamilus streckersoni TaxID=2493646 RepID=A0AAE0T2R1_9BIVA|nr:hypothetical protein CHS0354_004701 [Potamilus streckersoni]